tara:strand:- start:27 stop:962 length:936 start_codon:yes stop_codon:yes gene_type:complete
MGSAQQTVVPPDGGLASYTGNLNVSGTSTLVGDVTLSGHIESGVNKNIDVRDADGHVSGRLRNVSGSNNALTIEADPDNSASDTFMSFKIDTSEKARIGSDGNVFIGTSSDIAPANGTNLYVEDGTISRFGLSKTGSNARKFSIGNAGTYLNIYDETLDAEVFKIDANGQIIMPKQPAFMVYLSTDQNNFAVNSNVTVAFDTERFDQNGDFSSNTFTAPVTGKYQLNLMFRLNSADTGTSYYQVKIKTSNDNYSSLIAPNFTSDPNYLPINASVLADMDANDTASIEVYQSGGSQQTDVSPNSFFSGFLAC